MYHLLRASGVQSCQLLLWGHATHSRFILCYPEHYYESQPNIWILFDLFVYYLYEQGFDNQLKAQEN